MNPILASSLPMKKFLDPDNYTAPLHGMIIPIIIIHTVKNKLYIYIHIDRYREYFI